MTHEQVWGAIECMAAENNMSCSGLARYCGLDGTTFNRSKRWSKFGQPRWPSMYSISKVLNSVGADMQDFAKFFKTDKE